MLYQIKLVSKPGKLGPGRDTELALDRRTVICNGFVTNA